MNYNRASLHLFRTVADLICLIISFLLAEIILRGELNLSLNQFFILFSLALTWFISSRATNLYDDFRSRNYSYEFITLLKNVTAQALAVIVLIFFAKEYDMGRLFILYYSAGLLLTAGIEKYLIRRTLNVLRIYKRNIRTVLIVGAGEVGRSFYNAIINNPHYGYRVTGLLDDKKHPSLNGEYIGKIDDLEEVLNKEQVDSVIIALPNYAFEKLEYVISTCEKFTTRVRIIPDYFKYMSSRYSFSMFGTFPIISIRDDRLNEFHCRAVKRAFDFFFSLIVITFILSWLFPLIVLTIKLSSPGPAIFKQARWGRNNKKFEAYKFRSMKNGNNDVDESGRYRQADENDPRVTKIGAFLRKTNLDELPQFINVLKGEMSIVGPRPHPTPLNEESRGNVKQYMLRHLVKPGITGWAQVHGLRGSTKEEGVMRKRVEHDLWYIENWSFWLDIQILGLTVWRMIKGDRNAY